MKNANMLLLCTTALIAIAIVCSTIIYNSVSQRQHVIDMAEKGYVQRKMPNERIATHSWVWVKDTQAEISLP